MQTTTLGSSSLEVSRLCLGTMNFGWTATEAESFAVLDAFLEAGGNFIDTADIYSRWSPGNKGGEAEEIIGRWVKDRGVRDRVVIATKVRGRMWPGPDGEGLSPKHIKYAVNGSLKRLQMETIDLYQAHWYDENVPIGETLGAFAELREAGKVRAFGVSNYPPERLREAIDAAKANPELPAIVSLQPHHSLVHRKEFEGELQRICLEEGVGVIPYSPLASGFLTGKYTKEGPRVESQRARSVRQYFNENGWAVVDALRSIAAERGAPPSAVALAWSLAQPGVTAPIVGANSPAQLADQLPALTLDLAAEELDRLNVASLAFLENGDVHPGR
jgi:aryl-alcohol dehydrogenase-like predicted oxidoreductase